jgi:hypothetical protein
METNNWNLLFKYCTKAQRNIETNLVYTPLYTHDKLCMKFDHTHYYQNEMLHSWLKERPFYTKELVHDMFKREIKYLEKFKEFNWAPKILSIDELKQEIVIEWSGESCNNIIYSGRELSYYCPDWREQLSNIIKNILDLGFYKITLYPHCFFIQDGVLKTFDFYGTFDKNNPFLKIDSIKGIMGGSSMHRFEEATAGDSLNMETIFKRALESHVKWPEDELNTIYKKLF